MKKVLMFLMIALFAGVSVAGVKNVAVVETEIDAQSGAGAEFTSADARLVTTELRREAVKNLPRDRYNVMTSETVYAQGGAVLEECADENCVITLGSKIGADYIVRGIISRIKTIFTLSVEIYETENGNLVASSDPVRSENVLEMLEKAAVVCADMYRNFANVQLHAAPVPIPASEPVPMPAPPTVVSVAGGVKDVVDRVVAAVNAFKDATTKSIDAANAVKTAMQSKNFSAIKDAKKKVESATEAVKKAKTDISEAIDALKAAGPEAEAAVKAMGIDLAMFSAKPDQASASKRSVNFQEEAKNISRDMDLARSTVYFGAANPALLNEEKCMSAHFLFAGALESFYTNELGFTMPLGLYNAVGLSWIMDGASSYDATDDQGNQTGKKISDDGHLIGLTYAHNVWAGLTVGGNINLILQMVADMPDGDVIGNKMRFGFGVDAGLSYKVLDQYLFGLSMSNIINMISETDEKYPSELRFSFLTDFWKRRIYYGADFVLKDIISNAEDWVGAKKSTQWEFDNKVGVDIMRFLKLYGLFGLNNQAMDHYGFAFGMRVPGFSSIRAIEGMMQFVFIPNNGAQDANTNRITFFARMEFGKHREEVFADR